MSSNESIRGFTLFETLIATGILVTAFAGVAQLFVLGTQLTRQSVRSGAALVGAQDKLESLRGARFAYDVDGTAEAIRMAVEMTPAERRGRMLRMRQTVREHNIYRWAGLLLGELAGLPAEDVGGRPG